MCENGMHQWGIIIFRCFADVVIIWMCLGSAGIDCIVQSEIRNDLMNKDHDEK